MAKYNLDQLKGKWQEVKRIPAGGKGPVGFSDSLLININGNTVEIKDAISMQMSVKGVAQIEAPDLLIVAGDSYTIRRVDNMQLVIEDGEYIREMRKKDQYYFETVGKITIEKDSFAKPVPIDINNVKGKWDVYARKAAPGTTDATTALIRSLNIISIAEDGIAYGEIVYYISSVTKTATCQMVTKDGVIKIISDKVTWNLFAYKADGNELVFGETGKLVYFLKH